MHTTINRTVPLRIQVFHRLLDPPSRQHQVTGRAHCGAVPQASMQLQGPASGHINCGIIKAGPASSILPSPPFLPRGFYFCGCYVYACF
mmetsp:Transcript_32112/g.91054  ORF Transcript_32112/g.91054 Transcript_32112/m.91054 type:complete len:89 (-) Transcript_32112:1259-1525(-)